jgi:hypothetical protein
VFRLSTGITLFPVLVLCGTGTLAGACFLQGYFGKVRVPVPHDSGLLPNPPKTSLDRSQWEGACVARGTGCKKTFPLGQRQNQVACAKPGQEQAGGYDEAEIETVKDAIVFSFKHGESPTGESLFDLFDSSRHL